MEGKQKRKKQNINGRDYNVINVKVKPYLDRNGKVKNYKKFYGSTLKECREKCDRFNYEHGAKPQELFFGEMVEDFICNTFLPDPYYKESTKQRYIDAYNNNLAPMDITQKLINDITYRDMQAAYNNMTCAPSGVKSCHKLMRLFFKLMEREDICKDISRSLVVPKPKKKTDPGEVIVFTEEEIKAVKTYLDRKDLPFYENRRVCRTRFFFFFSINTGARISELLALTYNDIKPDRIIINKQVSEKPKFKDGKTAGHELVIDTTKTENSIRSIPITEETYALFEAHKKYLDLQMVISGKERCEIADPATLDEPYDQKGDFWGCHGDPEQSVILRPDNFMVVFPGDAHRLKICVDQPEAVTKIVFKILVNE